MNIMRWSETISLLEIAARSDGYEAAAVVGVVRILSTERTEDLSADLDAFSVFFPTYVSKNLIEYFELCLKIAAFCIHPHENKSKSISSRCDAIGSEEIKDVWMRSRWNIFKTT